MIEIKQMEPRTPTEQRRSYIPMSDYDKKNNSNFKINKIKRINTTRVKDTTITNTLKNTILQQHQPNKRPSSIVKKIFILIDSMMKHVQG